MIAPAILLNPFTTQYGLLTLTWQRVLTRLPKGPTRGLMDTPVVDRQGKLTKPWRIYLLRTFPVLTIAQAISPVVEPPHNLLTDAWQAFFSEVL